MYLADVSQTHPTDPIGDPTETGTQGVEEKGGKVEEAQEMGETHRPIMIPTIPIPPMTKQNVPAER